MHSAHRGTREDLEDLASNRGTREDHPIPLNTRVRTSREDRVRTSQALEYKP